MHKLLLAVLLSLFMAREAQAWIEIEEEDGDIWDCVGNYCYKDEKRILVKKEESRHIQRELGDPLAFPQKGEKVNDPLAFPKPVKNQENTQAF